MIRFGAWGGIIPRSEPTKLPDTAAQVAHNCNLTRGVLEPIAVTSPFISMTTAGVLNAEIPTADLKKITKPDAPTLLTQVLGSPPVIISAQRWICQANLWLTVTSRLWVTWMEDTYAGGVVNAISNSQLMQVQTLTPTNMQWTETSLTFELLLVQHTQTFVPARPGPYFVYGPRFQFHLNGASSFGGPESATYLPAGVTWRDPILPSGVVPLFHNGNIYAIFQAKEYGGPIFDGEIVADYRTVVKKFPPDSQSAVGVFTIDLHYSDPRRKHFFYVQTARTSDDEEGPPSEISQEVILRPGQLVTLSLPHPSGYTKGRLYRSTTGGDDFMLVSDVDSPAVAYIDDGQTTKTEPLPPYGNHPAPTNAEFLVGSVIHPAQFAAGFYLDHLYLSDYYRFWAWPEEYAIPFTANIDAIALAGNTILVFVGGKVYGVSGGNPAQMAKFLVSDTAPLLDKKTLARIGQTVFWCTNDGLAASTGGDVQIVTKSHYTREQWMLLTPQNFTAKVADNSIFLEHISGSHLRIDLDGGQAAVTTFEATSAVPLTWKSKKFWFDEKKIFDYARIVADGSVTLKVYADTVLVTTIAVTNAAPARLTGVVYANLWEFQLEANTVIREMEFFERQTVPVDNTGVILRNGESLYPWRRTRLLFKETGSFSILRVVAKDYTGLTVNLYAGGTLALTQSVTSAAEIKLSETLPNAREWEVEITRADSVDELHLIGRQYYSLKSGVVLIRRENEPFSWLDKRVVTPRPVAFSSARVLASAYPVVLTLYHNGTLKATKSIADEKAVRLPMIRGERTWSMDLIASVAGTMIHEVALATSMQGLRA